MATQVLEALLQQNARDTARCRQELQDRLRHVVSTAQEELARLRAREDYVPDVGYVQSLVQAVGNADVLRQLMHQADDLRDALKGRF